MQGSRISVGLEGYVEARAVGEYSARRCAPSRTKQSGAPLRPILERSDGGSAVGLTFSQVLLGAVSPCRTSAPPCNNLFNGLHRGTRFADPGRYRAHDAMLRMDPLARDDERGWGGSWLPAFDWRARAGQGFNLGWILASCVRLEGAGRSRIQFGGGPLIPIPHESHHSRGMASAGGV
ncbi:hypothetical protein C8R43DRAFT_1132413 [Mycena crocata]|nr:hypothetical protein C8R43DRAFT_1132413 [Mycena crocata]